MSSSSFPAAYKKECENNDSYSFSLALYILLEFRRESSLRVDASKFSRKRKREFFRLFESIHKQQSEMPNIARRYSSFPVPSTIYTQTFQIPF